MSTKFLCSYLCCSTSDSEEPEKKPKKSKDLPDDDNETSKPAPVDDNETSKPASVDDNINAAESSRKSRKKSEEKVNENSNCSASGNKSIDSDVCAGKAVDSDVCPGKAVDSDVDAGKAVDCDVIAGEAAAGDFIANDAASSAAKCTAEQPDDVATEAKVTDCLAAEPLQTSPGKRKPAGKRRKGGKRREKAAAAASAADVVSTVQTATSEIDGPETKRPCPQAAKAGRSRRKKESVEIPVENLRRSSRSNKGQRAIDPGTIAFVDDSPCKKRAIKQPEEQVQQHEEDEPGGKRDRKSKKYRNNAKNSGSSKKPVCVVVKSYTALVCVHVQLVTTAFTTVNLMNVWFITTASSYRTSKQLNMYIYR